MLRRDITVLKMTVNCGQCNYKVTTTVIQEVIHLHAVRRIVAESPVCGLLRGFPNRIRTDGRHS
jgi:hypothetical protein